MPHQQPSLPLMICLRFVEAPQRGSQDDLNSHSVSQESACRTSLAETISNGVLFWLLLFPDTDLLNTSLAQNTLERLIRPSDLMGIVCI